MEVTHKMTLEEIIAWAIAKACESGATAAYVVEK